MTDLMAELAVVERLMGGFDRQRFTAELERWFIRHHTELKAMNDEQKELIKMRKQLVTEWAALHGAQKIGNYTHQMFVPRGPWGVSVNVFGYTNKDVMTAVNRIMKVTGDE